MRHRTQMAVLGLISLAWAFPGCGSSTPGTPAKPGAIAPNSDGMDQAIMALKEINQSLPAAGQGPPGVNVSFMQVGTHRMKTEMDVSATTQMQDETAQFTFDNKTLRVDLANGTIQRNGQDLLKFPPSAKPLTVTYVKGQLSIKVDDQQVYPSSETAIGKPPER